MGCGGSKEAPQVNPQCRSGAGVRMPSPAAAAAAAAATAACTSLRCCAPPPSCPTQLQCPALEAECPASIDAACPASIDAAADSPPTPSGGSANPPVVPSSEPLEAAEEHRRLQVRGCCCPVPSRTASTRCAVLVEGWLLAGRAVAGGVLPLPADPAVSPAHVYGACRRCSRATC